MPACASGLSSTHAPTPPAPRLATMRSPPCSWSAPPFTATGTTPSPPRAPLYDAVIVGQRLRGALWTDDRRLLRALAGRLAFVRWIGDYALEGERTGE